MPGPSPRGSRHGMSLARNPALWTGLALIAIGGGNWINGAVKMSEYEAVASQPASTGDLDLPEEFPHLTERTNAALLEPLHNRVTTRSFAEGKRDFYSVVLTGGRLIVLLGTFSVIVATFLERRRPAAATP